MTDIERFNEFCDWWENHIDELAEKAVGHITKDFATVDGAVTATGEMSSKDFELALEELEDKSIYIGTCKAGEIINDTPLANYKLPKKLKEILDGKK